MFSTMTTLASTSMPKSSAPSDSRFAGICIKPKQIAANSRENGIVNETMIAPRPFPRNRNRMMTTRMMPSVEIVQHGVRGVVHQVAAIEIGNDLHTVRKNLLVQFVDLGVNAFQSGSRSSRL